MSFLRSAGILFMAVAISAQIPPSTISAPPDVASVPADATKIASGLSTRVVTPGTGKDHPTKDEIVVVTYTGWTAEGRMFDGSAARGKASTLAVNRVLPGLGEGLQLTVVGETRRLWIPEALAFKGQKGKPTGPLVFDVTLIDMPTRAPADVKAPPPDAKRTVSGLSYKVLEPGAGTRHPGKFDEVTVNYTGWTTDGKRFDSSLIRGTPATFPLDRVISGWTEGIQLMVEGEKVRFWIPENLAYQGKQAPYGTLVFDVRTDRDSVVRGAARLQVRGFDLSRWKKTARPAASVQRSSCLEAEHLWFGGGELIDLGLDFVAFDRHFEFGRRGPAGVFVYGQRGVHGKSPTGPTANNSIGWTAETTLGPPKSERWIFGHYDEGEFFVDYWHLDAGLIRILGTPIPTRIAKALMVLLEATIRTRSRADGRIGVLTTGSSCGAGGPGSAARNASYQIWDQP